MFAIAGPVVGRQLPPPPSSAPTCASTLSRVEWPSLDWFPGACLCQSAQRTLISNYWLPTFRLDNLKSLFINKISQDQISQILQYLQFASMISWYLNAMRWSLREQVGARVITWQTEASPFRLVRIFHISPKCSFGSSAPTCSRNGLSDIKPHKQPLCWAGVKQMW